MKQMYSKENNPWEEDDYLNDENLLSFSGVENVTLMDLYMTYTWPFFFFNPKVYGSNILKWLPVSANILALNKQNINWKNEWIVFKQAIV